jgi:hypothetical protein
MDIEDELCLTSSSPSIRDLDLVESNGRGDASVLGVSLLIS